MDAIEIIRAQVAACDQHREHAVVTIVQSDGAATRSQGKMLVYGDGTTKGTVGGGAVERLAVRDALQCIREGGSAFRTYDLNSPAAGAGMACGGCTSVLIEAYAGRPLLVMCGGGHVGGAVLRLAGFLGFDTLLLDDGEERDKAAQAGRFVRVRDFEADLLAQPIPAGAYIVIATHSHAQDGAALAGALAKQASYVGMIGSAKKVAALFARLREKGVGQEALDRVFTPVGLDLGGETPEEIALAIMAEILMVKNGRGGAHLTGAGN